MGEKLENFKAKLDNALHEKNAFTDVLEKIETKTNVRRLYLVMGVGGVLAVALLIGFFAEGICMLTGFAYPAYMSVKAIESHDKDDDTKWLTYWVVYSFFSLIEFFTDIFLFWIPFYWLLKCLFLLYCMVPTTWNGSITIYNRIIKPFFLKHQEQMDEAINKAADVAQDVLDEAEEAAKDAAADAARAKMD